jgi:vacuolar-type H+-ATPase subunit C/Vma6
LAEIRNAREKAVLKKNSYDRLLSCSTVNLMSLKAFLTKDWRQKIGDFDSELGSSVQKNVHNIGFRENRHFLPKI